MTIVNSAAITSPGFGSPVVTQRQNIALSGTVEQKTTIPVTPPLPQTFRTARVRVKIYSGGGTAPTVVGFRVTALDGTSTELVFEFAPTVAFALAANQSVDVLFQLIVEINANELDVYTTLGGTSPTASMDVELIAEP